MRAKAKTAPARQVTASRFSQRLRALGDPAKARVLQSFFKTGPGQYAEGDRFIGVNVPVIRGLVREFGAMLPEEALRLVQSPIHEERLGGLLLWVRAYEEGGEVERTRIFELYLSHTQHINNWDLVDLTAPHIVGGSLPASSTGLLSKLSKSPVLWERRIAVLATFAFIRQGRFAPSLALCRALLKDPHDLMHKACGWMLREIGKRDRMVLSGFLDRYATNMPRTMLRYALEHYSKPDRLRYMRRA